MTSQKKWTKLSKKKTKMTSQKKSINGLKLSKLSNDENDVTKKSQKIINNKFNNDTKLN